MSQPYGMPVQHQPGAPLPDGGNWMPRPAAGSDIPAGLEYLAQVGHIFVKQKMEILEVALGWETNNKYVITNGVGQQIYYAYEESDCCSRQSCGNRRGFIIHIVDNYNREVMRVSRDFGCCAGGCVWCAVPGSCCANKLTVEAPPGNVIGTVTQRISGCVPAYQVADDNEKAVLLIDSPGWCTLNCGCGDKEFLVKTMDNIEIGGIRKKWAGFVQEAYTDADNFGVNFPVDLSVRTKATLIGATFLIEQTITTEIPTIIIDNIDGKQLVV